MLTDHLWKLKKIQMSRTTCLDEKQKNVKNQRAISITNGTSSPQDNGICLFPIQRYGCDVPSLHKRSLNG